MTKRPTRLNDEPLIDAVFEVRFESHVPASSLLPGFFFASLDGEKAIERLPIAEVPSQFRDVDPSLRFAPVLRIVWDNFFILIGDRTLALACKLPYPGWKKFKPAIEKVVQLLSGAGIVQTVSRASMKYIDIIQSKDLAEQASFIELDLTLAGHKLANEIFQVRMEIPKDGFTHAVQLASAATVQVMGNETREGLIIDIDTIKDVGSVPIGDFIATLDKFLEEIHTSNIDMFFGCLKDETITRLRPVYE